MNKTVCILAAGTGSRLGPKTKYFPKALLKIGNKAAISHIIEYFPKDYKFVIAIGHLGDLVKQYVKIAHPDTNVTFVDAEKPDGPGYALKKCKPHIPAEFYVWNCDTLIKENPDCKFFYYETHNWIGYAQRSSQDKEYSSIGISSKMMVDSFNEKGSNYSGNAYIGCAHIKDFDIFWEMLDFKPIKIQNQYQVSAGFNGLLEHNKEVLALEFDWYDTGNLESLQKTKEAFKGKIENLDKEDEEIYFFDNYVVKYFYNEQVAENRAKRALTLGNTVPKIIRSSKNLYAYEYVDGKDLFSIPNPQDYVADLFTFMKNNLWKEKPLSPEECSKFHEACVDFYYRKTKKRIEQLFSKLGMYDEETIINGENIPKIFDLLSVLNWKKLLSGHPSLMHGDFNFSNILLTNEGFKLIDWRQDFGGIIEFGDMYYDLAKFYSGLLFPHDVVKNNEFEISVKDKNVNYKIENCTNGGLKNKYTLSLLKMLSWTMTNKDFNYDLSTVKQLANLCLINMSPLHDYPLNILLFYMGKHGLWQCLKEK